MIGGASQNRTDDRGVAVLCLTTWLWRHLLERKTGFEPATPTLARSYSTTELLPHKKLGWKGSNLRMLESKSSALPLGHSPIIKGRLMGIEPTNAGITIRCVNHFATTAILRWCRQQESNPRPTDYKSVALPAELHRQV